MKNRIGRVGAALMLATLVFGMPAPAQAAGIVLDAADLPSGVRAALRADVAAARAETPELCKQAYAVAAHAKELDEASRMPGAPLTMQFKALGPRALVPMLEMLALDGHAPRDLPPSAARALRIGLVEAVGIVRDGRAVPVLGIVLGRERDVEMTRAATEALARIGTDEAFAVVSTALAKAAGQIERERAVLDGMGAFKREAATRALAKRLDARPDETTAKVVARALGTSGNAWAWKTLADRAEEAAARDVAAKSLVDAHLAYAGETRSAIEKAILVVDAPATRDHITEARRRADADQARALDALAQRVANNPSRPR